jgi:biopolymer transport protein ExbD
MLFRNDGERLSGFASWRRSQDGGLNLTPVIDIVFLLIIFFLVVCQFIEAENFPVSVPDECRFAQSEPEAEAPVTTVTVMKTSDDGVGFAVGSERISCSPDADSLVETLTQLIDSRLSHLPAKSRLVTLRIDKDICFAHAQYALAGIAASSAAEIKLAALKDSRPGLP